MLKVQESRDTTSGFDDDLFQNKWFSRKLYNLNLIKKMPEGKAKEKEAVIFWWSIEDEDCFTTVFDKEIKEHIKNRMEDARPDQIVLQPIENQESEQPESMSEDEEPEESDDEELEENENEKENREINDKDSSNPYTNALTTMEWIYEHTLIIMTIIRLGSGASSHIIGNDKDLFAKLQFKAVLMLWMEHLCPSCVKGR